MRNYQKNGWHEHQDVNQPHSSKDRHVLVYDREWGQDVASDCVTQSTNQASDDRITRLLREFLWREGVYHEEHRQRRSSFIQDIRNARNPPEFKLPNMQPYDGRSDPLMHLHMYEQHMEILGATEEVMCRCFSLFLTNLATKWFCRLEPGSIDSWATLEKKFICQ